jgi:uncharacterized membrane protein YraQ (UPF0718 family)
MNKRLSRTDMLITTAFMLFVAGSVVCKFTPGVSMGKNFYHFAKEMLLLLPPAFVLIGLFDVWAKREQVEKHFGQSAGMQGFFWSILLAATTVGGTFVAFPVANALYHKGARLAMILSYITASSLVMIPMSIMETTILGATFTASRLLISLPLVVLSSILIERYLLSVNYRLPITDKTGG